MGEFDEGSEVAPGADEQLAPSSKGDRPPPWVQAAIRAGRPYAFKDKRPLVHNAKNLSALAFLLTVAGVTGWLSTQLDWWLYLPLATFLFGWVNFGLFVLVAHEASHNMFLVFEDRALQRKVNRVFGWMVTPLFATHYGKHWEKGHIEHHIRPMEPDDPQRSVVTGPALLGLILGYLFVPGFMVWHRTVGRKKKKGKSSSSVGVIVFFVVFWVTVCTLAGVFVGWPLAVALYMGIPCVASFNLVKGSLEHGGAIGRERSPFLRSRTSLFLLRPLLMPFNITLHFEHHLNFQVPWYDLPRYQRDLRAIVPEAVQADVFNHHLFDQMAGRLGGVSEEARVAREPLGAEAPPPALSKSA
jgi:fatty acid desaturase